MPDFFRQDLVGSTSALPEIQDAEAEAWGIINACEAASLLLESIVYNPGLPEKDTGGPKHSTDMIHRTTVIVNRRFSGAGGTQQILLSIGPKEVWKQLLGVEISVRRLDTGAIMARSKVGEEAYVRFPDVSFHHAYIFRLEEPVSE
ncbi:MAG: hypothetical protein KBC15_02385 [Candidatus Levybacteria bacterium]|nr:hypothetical protein [Candidatus Levybacteria bacterium]